MPNQMGMQRGGYQNQRSNFQAPRGGHGGDMMRPNSMGPSTYGMMPQPHFNAQMAPPPQMLNQSVISQSSGLSTSQPQFADAGYAQNYQ